jgi:hypothetical protein
MENEKCIVLNQLSISLEETAKKIETAYEKKDVDELNKLKKLFSQIQEKISENIK